MNKEAHLFDIDYRIQDSEPYLRLFLDDGKESQVGILRGFRPYLYLLPSCPSEELEEKVSGHVFEDKDEEIEVRDAEIVTRKDSKEKKEVIKVYMDIPPHIPKLKDEVKEWDEVERVREFDIPFYRRFLVDKGLRPPSKVKIEYEDTDESVGSMDVLDVKSIEQMDEKDTVSTSVLAFDLEVDREEVIMCSFYSEDFQKVLVAHEYGSEDDYVESLENEKKLLERFVEVIEERDPDVITGYNTDSYDFKVLRERFEEHGLTMDIGRTGERMKFKRTGRNFSAQVKGRMHLDLYPFVSTVVSTGLESETMDLDSVASEILGKEKEDMDWDDIKEFWREKKELDRLASYALKDSELAYELSENMVPQIFSLSVLVGVTPFDTCRTSYGQLVENFMIREAYTKDILVPNRPTQNRIGDRRGAGAFSGAFVYEPERGLHENIALFDFRSLYPTIIVAHNISPDVLDVEGCDEEFEADLDSEKYVFCQDEKGFVPEILENLVSERYELKEEMGEDKDTQKYRNMDNRQNALKILSNAFYGYLGYPSARWYSRECAEATTYLGRKYINDTIDIAEDMGFEVVYGDTDSVFIKGEDVFERAEEFQKKVNSELPEFMELELEGEFERGFFTYTESGRGAKKKYALLGKDGNVKITGFEYVRRDWSSIAKETQKKVIYRVLDRDIEDAYQVVKDTIERLENHEVPIEDLRIYTTLTKKPENYDSKAPHVEAAKKAIKKGEDIGPGDTIAYVITPGGGSISDRAEIARYASDYDPKYYVEKQVIPVALRVLKVFGYTESQLKGHGKQSGLGRFS